MSRPHWGWRDAREVALLPAVSADELMNHARAIARWERESGTPGEAQAYDYIEGCLKRYGLEVERREIEAYISLPLWARVILPDGSALEALTHSFSTSTPPDGVEAELVDVGGGTGDALATRGRGKLALVQSFATPGHAWAAQEAGTLGQLFVNPDHLHNMIVTTVWGTPTPATAGRIPRTPCCSIVSTDAERLRGLLAAGPLRVRVITRVRTEWMAIPHLTGHLAGTASDDFSLLSGHVDSWHFGAMDNATANATMLEVARLLAGIRGELHRGLRLAFWSGHSHGRYAGSAWYADHAWRELERRGVLHLNVDSTGARGATDYSVFHATEDAADFAEQVIADLTGQQGRARHFSRAGDQSFWGIGLPSAFMSMSQLPPQDTEFGRTIERLVGTSGFPWWWHTRDDTIDKIDPTVLTLDSRVYLAAALRLCDAPVLPLAPARAARAVAETARSLHAGERFDLSPVVEAGHALVRALSAHDASLARLAAHPSGPEAARANRALMRISRALVPLLYTTGDRFAHDLAVGLPPLAGLQPAAALPGMDPASDLAKFTLAALVRERNRVLHALDEAAELVAREMP